MDIKKSINPIIKREYYAVELKVDSPLNVSNGGGEYTDSDVLRNSEGKYFIPGTSIAGAMRNYNGSKKDEKCVYGFSKGNDGQMSSLWISDLYLSVDGDMEVKTDIRDGIQLGDGRTVENKFDIEIIERGAAGVLRIDYLRRKNDTEFDFDQFMNEILQGIAEGDIRFGSRKNRGFGRLDVGNIYHCTFDVNKKNPILDKERERWLNFIDVWNDETIDIGKKFEKAEKTTFEEWKAKNNNCFKSKYIKVRVPVKLTGGISIRKYSATGDANYEQISFNDNAVIPGSSLSGAVRGRMKVILSELGVGKERINKILRTWFGSEKGSDAIQSLIVFSESIIEGSKEKVIKRNKIDRFTNGTVGGALYTERTYFGGHTDLEYMIEVDDEEKGRSYKALIAMMELVMKDILQGYVAIGGLVSIGRGIFEPKGKDEKDWFEYSGAYDTDTGVEGLREEALAQLYQVITAKEDGGNG